MRNYLRLVARLMCYEGEGNEPPAGDPPAPPPAPPRTKVTFNPEQQEELNRILAEERRKGEAKSRKDLEGTERQLQAFLKEKDLTDQERSRLENLLTETQNKLLTAEERAANELKKKETDWSTKYGKLEKEHKDFVGRATTKEIMREIQDAAEKHGAFRSLAFYNELRDAASLVDATDENGRPTGDKKVVISFPITDPNTQETKRVNITPEEAVKRMKEMPEHRYLFKANVVGGTGTDNGLGAQGLLQNGQADIAKLTSTPAGMAKYMEMRKTPEGRRQLGLQK